MSTLTILRTDTVFAKLPIHTLTKSAPIDICIHQSDAKGIQELYWSVSPSAAYGAPQLLAYKLDTLVINRQLDALKRPFPSLICLGSLRQMGQALDQSRGVSTSNLKRAFHQNAGVYITAKLRYRDLQGKQRRLEAGFHCYGVVFTGESLPDGSTADAVYLILHESYRQVLNAAPTRPVDYDYLRDLKPLAQRFYELLSFKMYAALKYQHPQVTMSYSELCQFAPQQRHADGSEMSKQMHRVHQPHLRSGYLAALQTERIIDHQGKPDWLLRYTPGPKALAEYHAFTRPTHKAKPSIQMRTGVETAPGNPQMEARTTAPSKGESNTRAGRQSCEPAASAHKARELASHPSDAAGGHADPATDLVQQFYREVHGVADKPPHPQERTHASGLLQRYGSEFAAFFLHYAKRAMRQDGRTSYVFGGLMRYEASALAAYRRQTAQAAAHQADSSAQQRRRRLDAYEAWLRRQLDALKETLPSEQLEALREQARQQARSRQQIPSYLLMRHVEHEVETQLIQTHGLPSFEVWSEYDEMMATPSSATQARMPS